MTARSPIQQMVDSACGFTPEERARVETEKQAKLDAETQRLLAVADAALWWWRMRRPMGWTLKQHQRDYAVNCAGEADRTLAQACALLSLAGWPIRNPAANKAPTENSLSDGPGA